MQLNEGIQTEAEIRAHDNKVALEYLIPEREVCPRPAPEQVTGNRRMDYAIRTLRDFVHEREFGAGISYPGVVFALFASFACLLILVFTPVYSGWPSLVVIAAAPLFALWLRYRELGQFNRSVRHEGAVVRAVNRLLLEPQELDRAFERAPFLTGMLLFGRKPRDFADWTLFAGKYLQQAVSEDNQEIWGNLALRLLPRVAAIAFLVVLFTRPVQETLPLFFLLVYVNVVFTLILSTCQGQIEFNGCRELLAALEKLSVSEADHVEQQQRG